MVHGVSGTTFIRSLGAHKQVENEALPQIVAMERSIFSLKNEPEEWGKATVRRGLLSELDW
jgi:hypothetical protein